VTYRVVSSESKEAQIDSDKKMASDAGTADLTATDGGESGGGGGMGSTGSSSGMEFMLNKALMYDLKHEQVASDMKKYANWPTEGKIEFRKISMQYHTGPLVLKDLDIVVEGGQKIGIAGRTGSGKSSLMVTLFRIQELTGGAILIDGIDIATVPLAILRAKLGIIPQDPVMFSMNVRFNLDPFDLYTDLELYDALESVNMRTHVDSLPGRLNEMVAEGGENFSAGQRQLICIARALLRKPKILVLDEATASIDNETDVFIQEMVRNAFKNCTVLTIAHRLHTIVDSDKILVLDHGNTAEFDSPKTLLAKDKGDFKSLWAQHTASHQGNVAVSKSNENLASLVTDKNDKVTDKNDKASKGKAKGKK
jgi:ABC-type multidrug transport system fused ATPase/permease subunit